MFCTSMCRFMCIAALGAGMERKNQHITRKIQKSKKARSFPGSFFSIFQRDKGSTTTHAWTQNITGYPVQFVVFPWHREKKKQVEGEEEGGSKKVAKISLLNSPFFHSMMLPQIINKPPQIWYWRAHLHVFLGLLQWELAIF